jgi:hypothetical protein
MLVGLCTAEFLGSLFAMSGMALAIWHDELSADFSIHQHFLG